MNILNYCVKKVDNITTAKLIVAASIFLALFYNAAFFEKVFEFYPVSANNLAFIISLAVLVTVFIMLLFSIVSSKYTTKPLLMVIFLTSSFASYFMNSYGMAIDDGMIQNILQTNVNESVDLLSFKMAWYVVLLGLLPAFVVYKIEIKYGSFTAELISKAKLVAILLLMIVIIIAVFSKSYASFIREHKEIRSYVNPSYYIYSAGKYLKNNFSAMDVVASPLGEDAEIPLSDMDRELVILVVGETARADRFSLNGYSRKTNPLLEQEDVISFTNMHSCGTSTAVSVPCLFSVLNKNQYSPGKAAATENLLDVLTHAGVNVLWRENNSDSKGVALRVPYEDYKSPENNTVCDSECRDEGMLVGLQDYIDEHQEGDILIVLHSMGSHGPAYYKRYPAAFEKFTPSCKINLLEKCSSEEIDAAYDNTILYTDYFLSKVIDLLKPNADKFETAMFYMSDHGESLGENGLYLHGMPNFMAPTAQTHVGSILWLGDRYDIDKNMLKVKAGQEFSHDNLFSTILGLFEIKSSVYDVSLDITHSDSVAMDPHRYHALQK